MIPLLIVAAIGAILNDKQSTSTNMVSVGVIGPYTGIAASYGEILKQGIAEGLNNYSSTTYKIIYEDDECDPKKAVSAYSKLRSIDNVDVIIGPVCGSPQEALAPLAKQDKQIILLTSAAPNNVETSSDGWMINMQYPVETEGEFVAKEMISRGKTLVYIIDYNNSFSKYISEGFSKEYEKLGGKILLHQTLPNESRSAKNEILNIKSDLTKHQDKNNEIAIYSPDIAFYFSAGMKDLKVQNINLPVYGAYGIGFDAVKPLAPGVYYPQITYKDVKTQNANVLYVTAQRAIQYAIKINGSNLPEIIREIKDTNNYSLQLRQI